MVSHQRLGSRREVEEAKLSMHATICSVTIDYSSQYNSFACERVETTYCRKKIADVLTAECRFLYEFQVSGAFAPKREICLQSTTEKKNG